VGRLPADGVDRFGILSQQQPRHLFLETVFRMVGFPIPPSDWQIVE
jgi:hypothetical protein